MGPPLGSVVLDRIDQAGHRKYCDLEIFMEAIAMNLPRSRDFAQNVAKEALRLGQPAAKLVFPSRWVK